MFFPKSIFGIGFQLKTDKMNCLKGSVHYPFSQMFADTVKTHGIEWAQGFYCDRGMSQNEFQFWTKAAKVQ